MSDSDILSLLKSAASEIDNSKDFSFIQANSKIADIGLDSLSFMELIGIVEDELNIVITGDELTDINTVGELISVINEQLTI